MHRSSSSLRPLLCLFVLALTLPAPSVLCAQPFEPPMPATDDWDWIQMDSGEWFKGEIKALRDGALEFDSDELDILNLDWEDVAFMRTATVFSFRAENLGILMGTAVSQAGEMTVRLVDGSTRSFPHDDLLLIVAGAGRELDYWWAKATFGMVARSGNTDQVDFNTNTRIRRRTPRTRLQFSYLGSVGEVSGTTNIDNHNATGTLDAVIRSGFYVTPIAVNWFRDRFQNIASKTTLAVGLGYEILNTGDVDWDITLMGGYQDTRFESVQPGEVDQEDNFSLIPATVFSWDITGDIEFDFDYNAQIGLPDANRAFHHANSILSIDIYGDLLDLDLSLTWDRTESPRRDAEGTTPKRDDWRTSVGVGIEL